jgi:hypothetical protein
MKNILLISACCLVSCATPPAKNNYNVFPIEPEWVAFTREPVIDSVSSQDGTNFIVTDELVKKAIQQKNYIEKVKEWRTVNNVP